VTPLETFCRQVRARSGDHRRAFLLLNEAGVISQQMSILRQELDSMVRVIYLLSIQDVTRRNQLIEDSVNGIQWRSEDGRGRITDREMVELADQLQGWVGSVYRFGCAFIHLSWFHDLHERDPMTLISENERLSILQHMRAYHFGPQTNTPTINDLVPYLPSVFHKIANNLDCYVRDLEQGKSLDKRDLKVS